MLRFITLDGTSAGCQLLFYFPLNLPKIQYRKTVQDNKDTIIQVCSGDSSSCTEPVIKQLIFRSQTLQLKKLENL